MGKVIVIYFYKRILNSFFVILGRSPTSTNTLLPDKFIILKYTLAWKFPKLFSLIVIPALLACTQWVTLFTDNPVECHKNGLFNLACLLTWKPNYQRTGTQQLLGKKHVCFVDKSHILLCCWTILTNIHFTWTIISLIVTLGEKK